MHQSENERQAYKAANLMLARQLLIYLEDRRVLYDRHDQEDASHCVESALEMRKILALMMNAAQDGPLLDTLRTLRGAARDFVTAGGSKGDAFSNSAVVFSIALTTLRLTYAREINVVSNYFDLSVPADLRRGLSDVWT